MAAEMADIQPQLQLERGIHPGINISGIAKEQRMGRIGGAASFRPVKQLQSREGFHGPVQFCGEQLYALFS